MRYVTYQVGLWTQAADGDRVYLTFEGLRESRTAADKRTRIRITLSAQAAVHLWQQLADDVPAGPGGAPMPSKHWTPPVS